VGEHVFLTVDCELSTVDFGSGQFRSDLCDFFGHAQELLGGGGKGATAAVDQAQLALDAQFLDVHGYELLARQFLWTHMRGAKATPMPMLTNFLMVSTVGSSASILKGVRKRAKVSITLCR